MKIKKIEDLGFQQNKSFDPKEDKTGINLCIGSKFSMGEECMEFTLKVAYLINDDVEVLNQETKFICFADEELDRIICDSETEDNLVMNKKETERLLISLTNMAIGTVRGILFMKTQNTPLFDYPIPLLSIKFIVDHVHGLIDMLETDRKVKWV